MLKPEQEKTAETTQHVLRLIPGMKLVQYQLDLLVKRQIPGLLPVSVRNHNHEQEVVVDTSSYVRFPDWVEQYQINRKSDFEDHLLRSLLHIFKCADNHLFPLLQISSELDDVFMSSVTGILENPLDSEQKWQHNLQLIFWPVAVHDSCKRETQMSEARMDHLYQLKVMPPEEQSHDANHIRLIRNLGHFCEIDSGLISQIITCVRDRDWRQALILCDRDRDQSRLQSRGAKETGPSATQDMSHPHTGAAHEKEQPDTRDLDNPGEMNKRKVSIPRCFATSCHWILLAVFFLIQMNLLNSNLNLNKIFIPFCILVMIAHTIYICRQIQLKNKNKVTPAQRKAVGSKSMMAQSILPKIRVIQETITYHAWQFSRHWNSFFQARQTGETIQQTHYHQTMIRADDQQTYTMAILTEIQPESHTGYHQMTRLKTGQSYLQSDHPGHNPSQSQMINSTPFSSKNISSGINSSEDEDNHDNRENVLRKAYILTDQFIIGRDPYKSDFYLSDESIGRQHARIERKTGSFFLIDLGSANGSFVNGKKVSRHEEIWLPDQCEIQFGHLLFNFEIDE